MKWFEQAIAGGAQRAKFADIGPIRTRAPSWLPSSRSSERKQDSPSLRPPRLPSEFVDAMRQELDHEYSSRSRLSLPPEALGRRSELPSASVIPPSTANRAACPEGSLAAEPTSVDPVLVQAFEAAISLLSLERERLLNETAGQLAELAALIARRVIGRELSLDPNLVRGLVREGIQALGQHDRVIVRLGSGFASGTQAIEQDLRDGGARFDVRVDTTLEAYGCVVETDLGRVDESIESRLETLLQALKPASEPP